MWWLDDSLISDLPQDSCSTNYFGAALFADFDADGIVDIGLPCCADADCRKVAVINVWNYLTGSWQDFHITGLEVGFKKLSSCAGSCIVDNVLPFYFGLF